MIVLKRGAYDDLQSFFEEKFGSFSVVITKIVGDPGPSQNVFVLNVCYHEDVTKRDVSKANDVVNFFRTNGQAYGVGTYRVYVYYYRQRVLQTDSVTFETVNI